MCDSGGETRDRMGGCLGGRDTKSYVYSPRMITILMSNCFVFINFYSVSITDKGKIRKGIYN